MVRHREPITSPGLRALFSIVQISLIAVGTLFLLDAAVFRNSVYQRWLEPESAAGSLELKVKSAAHLPLTAPHRVLLFGDSQMTEGFSAKIAQQVAGPDWQFVNAAVPGSTPRTWYYMLRAIDPHRDRFTVVALPLPDYDDVDIPITYGGDHWDNDSDRELDAYWLAGELSLSDVTTFPWTFHSYRRRLRMLAYTLFKGMLLRRDFRQFLDQPAARIVKARLFAMHHDEWENEYTGNPASLEGMRIGWAPLRITLPATVSPAVARSVHDSYERRPEALGYMTEYRKRWLGGIMDFYTGQPVDIVLFRAPQRPIPLPEHWTSPMNFFIQEAANRPRTLVMDEHLFDDLEQPADYTDGTHLNRRGRLEFSRRFALAVSSAATNTVERARR